MSGRLLDQDKKDRLAQRYEIGHGPGIIGVNLGVSYDLVEYHALRMGLLRPPERRRDREVPDEPVEHDTVRGGKVRRFTRAEDDLIQDLEMRGLSVAAIAREVGRHRSSVTVRLLWLARRRAELEEPCGVDPENRI